MGIDCKESVLAVSVKEKMTKHIAAKLFDDSLLCIVLEDVKTDMYFCEKIRNQ